MAFPPRLLCRGSAYHRDPLNTNSKTKDQVEHWHNKNGHTSGTAVLKSATEARDRNHLEKQDMFLKQLVGPEGFEPSTNGL
jgi:hypothetical protein